MLELTCSNNKLSDLDCLYDFALLSENSFKLSEFPGHMKNDATNFGMGFTSLKCRMTLLDLVGPKSNIFLENLSNYI